MNNRNRSSILEAAANLFARQGFAGASLQAIAKAVGITKPSLLYHFPSKDNLREEVLGSLFEHWTTRIPALLRAVSSGEGQFEALMDELGSFFREDANRAHLLLRELMDRPDEMRRRMSVSLAPLVSLVADGMRKGQAQGTLRGDVDPEAYVLHMVSFTVATIVVAPVIEPILSRPGQEPIARAEAELRRIASSSLFSDFSGSRVLRPEAKPHAAAER